MMVEVKSAQEIRKAFIQWNGWGPPTSEYQINEFCRADAYSEEDSEHAFWILMDWLNGKNIN